VATMATLTVRSGSDGFGRIREDPCKLVVSAIGRDRARTLAHRTQEVAGSSPASSIENAGNQRDSGGGWRPSGTGQVSQAVVKYLDVHAFGNGCAGGQPGVALAELDRSARAFWRLP
jgi:hypothetical protein